MPQIIALKCPSCNAPLETPDDRPEFYCQFCGSRVVAAEALQSHQPEPQAWPIEASPLSTIPGKLRIEDFGNELTISWRWFTGAVFFLIPFAIAWNAFLIGWYAMATNGMPGPMKFIFLVFPIAHVAVGLGLIYAIATILFNRTTVRVRNGELSISHGPIFYPGGRTISVDQIDQLYCETNVKRGSNGSVSLKYPLKARLKSGRSLLLLAGESDLALSRSVEQLVEKHLGLENRRVAGEAAR